MLNLIQHLIMLVNENENLKQVQVDVVFYVKLVVLCAISSFLQSALLKNIEAFFCHSEVRGISLR